MSTNGPTAKEFFFATPKIAAEMLKYLAPKDLLNFAFTSKQSSKLLNHKQTIEFLFSRGKLRNEHFIRYCQQKENEGKICELLSNKKIQTRLTSDHIFAITACSLTLANHIFSTASDWLQGNHLTVLGTRHLQIA